MSAGFKTGHAAGVPTLKPISARSWGRWRGGILGIQHFVEPSVNPWGRHRDQDVSLVADHGHQDSARRGQPLFQTRPHRP
jgi:hypothetical protein